MHVSNFNVCDKPAISRSKKPVTTSAYFPLAKKGLQTHCSCFLYFATLLDDLSHQLYMTHLLPTVWWPAVHKFLKPCTHLPLRLLRPLAARKFSQHKQWQRNLVKLSRLLAGYRVGQTLRLKTVSVTCKGWSKFKKRSWTYQFLVFKLVGRKCRGFPLLHGSDTLSSMVCGIGWQG